MQIKRKKKSRKAKKETAITLEKLKTDAGSDIFREDVGEVKADYGGLPELDFKKNLGCG